MRFIQTILEDKLNYTLEEKNPILKLESKITWNDSEVPMW